MSIYTRQAASLYGALDSAAASAALSDGTAASAHVLRELARSSNRLAERGGPLLNLIWDASTDGATAETGGALSGRSTWGWWSRLVPGPIVCPKKGSLTAATLRVHAVVEGTQSINIQIGTAARPFSPAARPGDDNVITCTGDGGTNIDRFEKVAIPLGRGALEPITLDIMGDAKTALASEATFGANNSGTVDFAGTHVITDASSSWNVAPAASRLDYQGRHCIAFFHTVSSSLITYPRRVVYVQDGDNLVISPPLTAAETQLCTGANYEIRELPTWRIASIAIYTEDLT